MQTILKIIQGGTTIDLNDGTVFTFRRPGPVISGGNGAITIPLTVKASGRSELIRRVNELRRVLANAGRRLDNMDTVDTYLYYAPDTGIPTETVYGRGGIRFELVGGDAPWQQVHQAYFATADLNDWPLTLQILPHRGRYFGHGQRQWLGEATGGIEPLDKGSVRMWAAASNLFTNPSFLHGTWNNDWAVEDAGIVASQETAITHSEHSACKLVCAGTKKYYKQGLTLTIAPYVISGYAYMDGEAVTSADLLVWGEGAAVAGTTFAADADHSGWYRFQGTFTGSAGASTHGVQVQANKTVYIDDLQLELGTAATPFCRGGRRPGETWAGTAHDSTSTRAAAKLKYNAEKFNPRAGGIAFTVVNHDWNDGAVAYFFDCAVDADTSRISIYKDASNDINLKLINDADTAYTVTIAADAYVDATEYRIVAAWKRNSLVLYVNGASVGTPITSAVMGTGKGASFYVGSDYAGANQARADIYDLRVWDTCPTAAQALNEYSAGRGWGEMPYLWSTAGDGTLYNHDDAGAAHDNWLIAENVPGDVDAGVEFYVKNLTTDDIEELHIAMRSVAPLAFAPCYEGESGTLSDFVDTVDADCSNGHKARTSAAAASIIFTVENDPRKLGNWQGKYDVWARVYDGHSALGNWTMDCAPIVNQFSGDYTTEVSAPALSQWCWVNLGEIDLPPLLPSRAMTRGYAANTATSGYLQVRLTATRASGAAETLDIDYIMLMPKEQEGAFYGLNGVDGPDQNDYLIIDSVDENAPVYVAENTDAEIRDGAEWYGDMLELTPDAASWIGLAWVEASDVHDNADTILVTARYEPRFGAIR